MVRVTTWIMVAMLAGVGLAAGAAGDDSVLAGTRWKLDVLGADAKPAKPVPTLDFGDAGRVSGSDGCNLFHGDYKSTGNTIRFGPQLAGTLMACPDAIEAQARAYREALHHAARFQRDATHLQLEDADGHLLLRFIAAAVSPVGSKWEVVSYNNGKQAVVSVAIGSSITAEFGQDGRVTGTAGCNRYRASYALEGSDIQIGLPQVTRRVCAEPPDVMRQETLFLAALQTAAKFEIRGDRLELRTASGSLAVGLNQLGN